MNRSLLRACQCGGRAAWSPAGKAGRRRGRPWARTERLACPACGNATGWCGLGPAAREGEPFGPEWRGQMMRMGKADLVTLYEARCKEGLAMEAAARGKREKISALEEAVARLRVWRTRRELAAVIDRLVQRGIVAKADAAGAKSKLMESNG